MPVINPRELEIIITEVNAHIDDAIEEAYNSGMMVIKSAYEKGVDYGNGDLKPRASMIVPPDPAELDFLSGYNLDLIKGLGEDVKKDVKRVIRDGIANGKSVNQVAADLRKVLRLKEWRINTIARTEVMRAANYGRYSAWKRSGVVKGKEWVTAWDDRTCDICMGLDGERRRLDAPFSIGVMMPPAHPNCRCTAVPVFIDEKLAVSPNNPKEIKARTLEREYSAILKRAFKTAVNEIIQTLNLFWGG